MENKKNNQLVLAISGVKNSGKTTLIENIVPLLMKNGFNIATIKHDGHDFCPDVPNTDTYKHKQSGAYGVGIFSDNRFMVTKDIKVSEKDMIDFFPEADIILLEGFKNSSIQKIEISRAEISKELICSNNVIAVVSDNVFDESYYKTQKFFGLEEYEKIVTFIEKQYNNVF